MTDLRYQADTSDSDISNTMEQKDYNLITV